MKTLMTSCLAALVFAAALALAPAAAAQTTGYAAYTVSTYNGGPQGMAGRIRDNGSAVTVTRNLRSGLGGDPVVEGVVAAKGQLRIAVTNRVSAPGAVPPTYIYNATPATNPLPVASPTWPNVRNMSGLVRLGKYLYAMDYDNARVVEIDRVTYAETGVSYTVPASLTPAGFAARGQALIVVDNTLYGLFAFPNASFSNYADSLLVRFTVKGGKAIKVKANDTNAGLVKNAFAISAKGSNLFVAGIGGSQSGGAYNKASRLQRISATAADFTTAQVKNILRPTKDRPFEIRDISFKGGTAYVLLGAYDANFTMTGQLVSTTDFETFTVIDDFSAGAPGYFWSAQFVADNKRIYFGRGDRIVVYDAKNTSAPPVATLTLTPGSLISSGDPYDNINDFAYVGADGSSTALRGYRSPVQLSQGPQGQAARALAKGRPELTEEEQDQLDARFPR
jgi:hypothetical protein